MTTKRFQFRLRTVQRVRRIEEDRARSSLLVANHAVAAASHEIVTRRERYWDAPRPTGLASPTDFRPAWFDLELAAQGVQWATARRIEAQAHADAEREAWMHARRRVEALERLETREHDEWKVEYRRSEDALVDDLVVSRASRPGPASWRTSTGTKSGEAR